MTPSERLADIEKSAGDSWQKDLDNEVWLITRVRKLTEALEEIRSKTITDPANDVELMARVSIVFNVARKALDEE